MKLILTLALLASFTSCSSIQENHSRNESRKISSTDNSRVEFNKVKIASIQFLKDVTILPGTDRTELSNVGGRYQKCFLIHDKETSARIIPAGRSVEVTSSEAVSTSFSSYGGSGFAQIFFEGLKNAKVVFCELSSTLDTTGSNSVRGIKFGHVEKLFGDSLAINTEDSN